MCALEFTSPNNCTIMTTTILVDSTLSLTSTADPQMTSILVYTQTQSPHSQPEGTVVFPSAATRTRALDQPTGSYVINESVRQAPWIRVILLFVCLPFIYLY
ncbi:hypothetical protein BJX65DRAFT_288464 [Aspergillus insuetus]